MENNVHVQEANHMEWNNGRPLQLLSVCLIRLFRGVHLMGENEAEIFIIAILRGKKKFLLHRHSFLAISSGEEMFNR